MQPSVSDETAPAPTKGEIAGQNAPSTKREPNKRSPKSDDNLAVDREIAESAVPPTGLQEPTGSDESAPDFAIHPGPRGDRRKGDTAGVFLEEAEARDANDPRSRSADSQQTPALAAAIDSEQHCDFPDEAGASGDESWQVVVAAEAPRERGSVAQHEDAAGARCKRENEQGEDSGSEQPKDDPESHSEVAEDRTDSEVGPTGAFPTANLSQPQQDESGDESGDENDDKCSDRQQMREDRHEGDAGDSVPVPGGGDSRLWFRASSQKFQEAEKTSRTRRSEHQRIEQELQSRRQRRLQSRWNSLPTLQGLDQRRNPLDLAHAEVLEGPAASHRPIRDLITEAEARAKQQRMSMTKGYHGKSASATMRALLTDEEERQRMEEASLIPNWVDERPGAPSRRRSEPEMDADAPWGEGWVIVDDNENDGGDRDRGGPNRREVEASFQSASDEIAHRMDALEGDS